MRSAKRETWRREGSRAYYLGRLPATWLARRSPRHVRRIVVAGLDFQPHCARLRDVFRSSPVTLRSGDEKGELAGRVWKADGRS